MSNQLRLDEISLLLPLGLSKSRPNDVFQSTEAPLRRVCPQVLAPTMERFWNRCPMVLSISLFFSFFVIAVVVCLLFSFLYFFFLSMSWSESYGTVSITRYKQLNKPTAESATTITSTRRIGAREAATSWHKRLRDSEELQVEGSWFYGPTH